MARKNVMKMAILGGLVVCAALFLATCGGFSAPEVQNNVSSNVDYVYEGGTLKAVKINFRDSGTARQVSRGLSDAMAQFASDFYEVAFSDGTNVARASWERGGTAFLTNVPGLASPTGIDYDATTGTGSAVLFVGKKTGKTLLAVGLLTDVYDAAGNNTNTVINSGSVSATFSVSALKAPTPFALTGSTTGTVTHGGNSFTMYHIGVGPGTATATYTIDNNTTDFAADYAPLILVTAGAKAELTTPKYSRGGTTIDLPGTHANLTTVAMTNNLGGAVFAPGVTCTITTAPGGPTAPTGAEGFAAFSFEVPVNAISAAAATDGVTPGQWYIRPSFSEHQFNLDDGVGGNGGAMLIGVGDGSAAGLLITY